MVQIQSKGQQGAALHKSAARTKNSQEDIEQAVRRYLDKGESVGVLAKYYKVSQPAVYKWIQSYKEAQVAKVKTSGMTEEAKKSASSRDKDIIIEQLQKELRTVRDKLMDVLIETGRL